MQQYLQNTLIKNLADTGCYFLCLCEIAERETSKSVDIIKTAIYSIEHHWIEADFTVLFPEEILHYLTGYRYSVTKSDKIDTKANFVVEKWHNDRTGYSHFRLEDWDSLKDSVTVKEGKPTSFRNITRY